MVEHLLNLLSCHHLLHEAVYPAKLRLLSVKILFALFSVHLDEYEHQHKEHDNNERQPHAQHHHHNDCSEQLHEALYYHCKAAVHRLLNRVHIIGKTAHKLTVRVCIEVA